MARKSWVQNKTAARACVHPFMSYSTTANGSLSDSHATLAALAVAQANDFDDFVPNDNKTFYNNANRVAIRAARTAATRALSGEAMFSAYNNDSPALVRIPSAGDGTGLAAAEAGRAGYASLKDYVLYDVGQGNSTPAATTDQHDRVSRVPSGNYVMRVWDNVWLAQLIEFYASFAPNTGTAPFDAVNPDVMGHFPAQHTTSIRGQGAYNPAHPATPGYTEEEWIGHTSDGTFKMARGGATAAESEWVDPAPCFPNGLFNGPQYWGVQDTRRLAEQSAAGGDVGGGMIEEFGRVDSWVWNRWLTNADLILSADMMVDAEEQGWFFQAVTKVWIVPVGDAATWLSRLKQMWTYYAGTAMLGMNGRCAWYMRDDNVDGAHRQLPYPSTVPTVTGRTTVAQQSTGRAHIFQSMFFAENDRWWDRLKSLGVKTGTFGMANKPYTVSSGLFQRVWGGSPGCIGGYHWVNNNDANTGTAGMPASPIVPVAGTYISHDGTTRTFNGTTDRQMIPARSGVFLMRLTPLTPGTPSIFGTPTATSVSLGWGAPTNTSGLANHYEVEFSADGGTSWVSAASNVPYTTESLTHTFASSSVVRAFRYRVRLVNNDGAVSPWSAMSSPANIPAQEPDPEPPTPVPASRVGITILDRVTLEPKVGP